MYVGFDTRFFELAADILDLGLVRKSTNCTIKRSVAAWLDVGLAVLVESAGTLAGVGLSELAASAFRGVFLAGSALG